ncbi:MAG: hypothetical protein IJ513_09800 [Bacteroidaceae bacterium]|nr:hypothetical protein [Bacteroidaceae bacterium]
MNKEKDIKQWLAIVEKYFDATATTEEEKALAAFLATEESDIPEFNEVKAVMGYLATARAIEKEHSREKAPGSRRFAARWMTSAAAIAIVAFIGYTFNSGAPTDKDVYIANINGRIYTDKEFVLAQMQQTMAMIGNTTRGNSIDEQLEAMFNLANN